MKSLDRGALVASLLFVALGGPIAAQDPSKLHDPREKHLANVRQLTFSGENAEAYWSPDGKELIYQWTGGPYACDQIFRMAADGSGKPVLVSTGKGRTTCAYFFFPTADRILYSSTHKTSEECPPTPDRSQGYVWPLYDSYEIYTARPDGTDLAQLTDNKFYDAEATVCPKDGTILFTSTRDGDLELYTMKPDGSDVKRLTNTPGYDGGAFFSPDCTQIVWRASRPKPGPELDDFRRLLALSLVRPNRLEIFVAKADGSDARQVTYLSAASFGPSFTPDGTRILFSSSYGDPKSREFDIWAVNTDGSGLERITYTSAFDGFPLFSPDGKKLVFASNRNQGKPGETDIYVADWVAGPIEAQLSGADRVRADVNWLADDAREGRGVNTKGLGQAAAWLEKGFQTLGLEPAGENGTFRQGFEVPIALDRLPATKLAVDGVEVGEADFAPSAASISGGASGAVVSAGFGITAADLKRDDYEGVDAKGKIVLVRRFVPAGEAFQNDDATRRYGDLRYKVWNAREHGAVGVLIADLPELATGEKMPDEAPFPSLVGATQGDSGLPVALIKRELATRLLEGRHEVALTVALEKRTAPAHNIVGRLTAPAEGKLAGTILFGAHYDHLGFGDRGSLEPDSKAVHNGADDNASGTAALLEVARLLVGRAAELKRDVILVAFSAEESGALGSTHAVRHPLPGARPEDLVAMVNFDMVGRMREDQVSVLGGDSAAEWKDLVAPACEKAGIVCAVSGDGYGPSDQSSYYGAGVPVLQFFTGVHSDYHKPSDDASTIHSIGIARVAAAAADLAVALSGRGERLTYKAVPAPPPSGDVRATGGSLGTVPDYAGDGRPGLLLAGVRAGGPAEKAGLKRGDLIVEVGGKPVRDVNDFMFILRSAKAGVETVVAVVRDGKRIELLATYGPARMR